MRFLLSELAAAVDGRLVGPDRQVTGASIDSRTVERGQLFVPIVAERDGHEFIGAAVAAGATAYLSAHSDGVPAGGRDGEREADTASAVLVADTGEALTALGSAARGRLEGPVIGITGSVGKTSVKDLTRAACGPSAWASAASFNNELGVPLTLANAPDETSVAVVEMGARGIGHIRELCGVARPTIGLVTCVALAHSELFGSIEAVAEGKGELIEAVPADGCAVLNADDPNVLAMAERTSASVITYGTGAANVRVEAISLDAELRPTFRLNTDWGSAEVTLQARGAHMALNAGAAAAAAMAADVPFDAAVAGLRDATLSRWRMEVATSADGLIVVNDAYNANPTSMRAALDALRALEATSRFAVLGAMAELGEEGPAEHLAITREAAADGIPVIAVDAPGYGPDAEHVADRDAAFETLTDGRLSPGAAVLVKGSRVAELEHLAERLLAR